ncbi:MAG: type IV pilus twitching motility protein PilT [Planctomycetes bacterium]|nr:type IV pilus twitching motility protein PilT [Planctomycetota bacterium]
MDYRQLFGMMVQEKASDLFIKVGVPPSLRMAGRLRSLGGPPVTPEIADGLFKEVASERIQGIFEENGEADTAYEIYGVGRFRCNIFRQRGYIGFVFRHVNSTIPALESLSLPTATLKKIAVLQRGLVLVTGVTGSGKSTTLASMLNYMNANLPKHIVTVEDPIEFLFADQKCLIDQRELGIDTMTFEKALKGVVRQSPDVIMIGELRDKDTMEAALHAAETGHLVFSTLHTRNASQTIERIMNFFPPHQYEFLRTQLSLLLEGVISQRLIPCKDGKTRVPAAEVMVRTPTIQELLYEGKFREIYKSIKEGAYFGTQTFNQSLKDLFQKDLITLEEAISASDNPEELKLEMRGIQKGARAGDFDFKI